MSIHSATGLVGAHLLAVADAAAAAIAIPLHGQTVSGAHAYFGAKNMIAATILVVLGLSPSRWAGH